MSSMMRVETSVTGFTVWLIISAGMLAACNPAAIWRSAVKHEFGRMFLGDRHVEQAGKRGEFRLPAQDAQALLEQVGLQHRAAGDVQRIVRRAETRQRGAQFSDRGVRQRGHRHAQHLRAVRDDFARAAGDRHQRRDPRGCSTPVRVITSAVNSRSSIEFDAHDAELAADAVEHPVVADQRAGVRLRGPRGDFRQADLQHDDRLCRGDRASRSRGEAWRMADRLGEQRDRPHLGLIDQMVDEVARNRGRPRCRWTPCATGRSRAAPPGWR